MSRRLRTDRMRDRAASVRTTQLLRETFEELTQRVTPEPTKIIPASAIVAPARVRLICLLAGHAWPEWPDPDWTDAHDGRRYRQRFCTRCGKHQLHLRQDTP